MIEHRTGDLLKETDLNAIVHQCNLRCTFGSGIAAAIRIQFPAAYEADCEEERKTDDNLGSFSYARVEREFGTQYIFNMYSQADLGRMAMITSYFHMYKALQSIKGMLLMDYKRVVSIGFPHGMGCGIATGDWKTVEGVIREVFEDSKEIKAVIVKLP